MENSQVKAAKKYLNEITTSVVIFFIVVNQLVVFLSLFFFKIIWKYGCSSIIFASTFNGEWIYKMVV